MKKSLFGLFALLSISLQSCSPALQSGGWIIPVGLLVVSAYSFIRYFTDFLGSEGKGERFALICAISTLAASIISYLVMGVLDK